MRKIFFSPPLWRGMFSMLVVLTLTFLGVAPANAEDLIFGEEITVGYSGVGTKYNFTPSSDCIIKVTLQPKTGYEGASFGQTSVVYKSNGTGVDPIESNAQKNGAPYLTNMTEGKWAVSGGQPYYIQLPYWSGTLLVEIVDDNVSSSDSNKESQVEEDIDPSVPVIENEVETTIGAMKTYRYHVDADGILSIHVNSYSTGLGMLPNQQYFVFTDSKKKTKAKAIKTADSDYFKNKGWVFTFEVTAGMNLYLYNNNFDSFKFYCSLETEGPGVIAKLVDVQPLPGAIDNTSYEATLSIQFEPTDVVIESVDFVYTDKNDELQTINNVECKLQGGAYQIPKPQYMTLDGKRFFDPGNESTSDEVVVASLISNKDNAIQKYVLNKVSYKGSPLAESEIKDGVEIANDGTLTLNYYVSNPPVLESAILPDPFYMSWEKGDPRGIAVIKLTKEISTAHPLEVNIMEGAQTYGETPNENDETWMVPNDRVTVEGKTITIDFTGEGFATPSSGAVWGESNPDTDVITLFVGGIVSVDGQTGNFGGPAYMPQLTYVNTPAPTLKPEKAEVKEISPERFAQLELNQDGTASFKISFTDDVNIQKATDSKGDFNLTVSPENNEDVYADEFVFTFPFACVAQSLYGWDPYSGLEPGLNATIIAVDKSGNEVTYGGVDGYIETNYVLAQPEKAGAPFSVIVAESSDEGYLNSFNVEVVPGFDKIEAVDENAWDDASQKYVNFFKSITIKGDNFTANASAYEDGIVTFEPEITESGDYIIEIPYHAFSIAIENNDQLSGQGNQEGDIAFWSQKKTVDFHIDITGSVPDEPIDENVIVFNDKKWAPLAYINYYYKPSNNGVLRLEILDAKYGRLVKTTVAGGIYDNETDKEEALAKTDSSGDMWGKGWHDDTSYMEYNLTAGKKYYFRWNKNGSKADFYVHAIWYEGDFDSTVDHGDSETTAMAQKYEDLLGGVNIIYDNRNLSLTGSGGVNISKKDISYSDAVAYEINEDGNALILKIGDNLRAVEQQYSGQPDKIQGIYAVTIKRGTVEIENGNGNARAVNLETPSYNAEHTLYYYVTDPTGVTHIIDDVDGVYRVYNLQGVNVLNTTDALEINNLQPGIYIVNGKKVKI